MSFTEINDVGGTTGTAQIISVGEEVYGLWLVPGDVDVYRLQLTAGQSYTVTMGGDPSYGYAAIDTYFEVLNPSGFAVTSDDDSGLGLTSYVQFTATTTGTYYIVADDTWFDGGDYVLAVYQNDVTSNSTTTMDALVGQEFSVSLSAGDTDWVRVSLEAGVTYLLNSAWTWNCSASGVAAVFNIYNSSGTLIANAGQNLSSGFTPSSTGTYYLGIGSDNPSVSGAVHAQIFEIGGGGGTGGWDAPNLSGPLTAIDWGYTVPDTRNPGTSGITEINVFFAAGSQSVTTDYASFTTSGWSTAERAAAGVAFDSFEAVANVQFNIVTDVTQADFVLFETTNAPFGFNSSALGFWGINGGTVTYGSQTLNLEGFGVFMASGTGWSNGLAQGGYGYVTLIHEIGHGLGLAHPHDDGGSSSILPGVTSEFDTGNFDLNQGIWTTMSYIDGFETATHVSGPLFPNTTPGYGWQGSLMAFDLAVLQDNYGANLNTATGNDTYVLDTANAAGTFYAAIWDTAGTDTIIHNGSAASNIDLRPATLAQAAGGGGFVSWVSGIHGGFTIAAGVVIENAAGGSGADIITGNAFDNVLDGRGGNDRIDGGAGNDRIVYDAADAPANVIGGADFDTLVVINQAAPTTFDLVAQGFEKAEVTTTDTTNQWWSSVVESYGTNWQRTNAFTYGDNGSSVLSTFDPNNLQAWSSVSDYVNSAGILTNQDGVFDSGTIFVKAFDYAPGTAVDGIDDWLSEYTYFFRNQSELAAGNPLNVEGFTDDGRKFTQTNDIDGAYDWTYQTVWYDDPATSLTFIEIGWDDGRTEIVYL